MKPIRLHVRMPMIGVFSIKGRSATGEIEDLVETMIFGLRRQMVKGVLSNDSVRALAFVPEKYLPHLRESGKLVDGEYTWCIAEVADNRKSLAPFLASGDPEWLVDSNQAREAE